ncbi:MAG: DNA polymerase III subunit chi [Pseudomonadota bacterium]|nr:DNA polymerase III subunit chi [Pseudomonadota bacterium]
MSEVLFYHLERASLESVLPGLLEKSLERGWKAVVRTGARDRLVALSEHLWTYRDDAFLPHAAGGENGARQPVWLTDADDVPNAAEVLFLVEGATAEARSLDRFQRSVAIFDGREDAAVEKARAFWKEVKAAGHDATYWKQSPAGRWEKQG